ncbi:phage tail tape measure protein [Brevibacillus massiliensis]|uniref:phage tail tape measure protein n=1 Tax=Brevibacillus massiliensis TaxID=1118054 RepID=UPI0002F9A4AC|nr:phage tail tape measure protein [Brevibacillus massiliensis]
MGTVLDLAIAISLTDRVSNGVNNIIRQFGLMRNATEDVQKKMNALKNMAWTGGAFAAGGVLAFNTIANAAKEAVTQAGNLQEVMTAIKTQTFGKDLLDPSKASMINQQMKEIKDISTRLGLETTFSNLGAGEAILELQKGGVAYTDIINGAAEATLKFAQLNKMLPTVAAEAMVQTRAGFQLTGQQMLSAADIMTKVAAASSASAEDINRGLGNMGGVASQMWGSRSKEQQVLDSSVLVALARTQTPEGASAGTFVRNFLERLVPQTKMQTKMMEEVGWVDKQGRSIFLDYSKDSRGQLKSAQEIAKILRKTVGTNSVLGDEEEISRQFELANQGMGTDKVIKLFHKVFGEQGGRTAYTLLRTGEGSLEEIYKNFERQLGLNEQVALQMENFNQVLDTSKEAWDTFLTTIGTPLLQPATTFFKGLTNTIAGLTKYFEQHPQVSKFMFAVAGGASAFIAVSGAILVGVAAFGALRTALGAAQIGLRTVLGVSAGVTLGIAGIAGAAYLIYKNWDQIGPYAKAVWDGLKKSVSPAVDWFQNNVAPVIRSVTDGTIEQFQRLESWISTNKAKIEAFFGFSHQSKEELKWEMPGWMKGIGMFGGLLLGGAILDKTVAGVARLGTMMRSLSALAGPVRWFAAFVRGEVELRMFGGLLGRTVALLQRIPGVSGILRIGQAFMWVGRSVMGIMPILGRYGAFFGRVLWGNIAPIGQVIAWIARLGGRFAWLAGQALWMGARMALAWMIGLGPVGWIIAGVTALIAGAIIAWNTNFLGFRDKLTAVWNWTKETAIRIWNSTIQGLSDLFTWFKELPEKAKTWGTNLIDSFVNGIKNKLSAIPEALKSAAQTIKDWLGIASPTKEGPLRTNHLWGGNLMKSIAGGMLNNLHLVKSAAALTADAMLLQVGSNGKPGVSVSGPSPRAAGSIIIQGPLIGEVHQQPGEDADALAKRVAKEAIAELARMAKRGNLTIGTVGGGIG